MQIDQSVKAGVATLKLLGRFDFNTQRSFHECVEKTISEQGITALDIDLGAVDYLDSAALGMLLLARERVATRNIAVRLTQTVGAVRQLLDVANFGKIFTIT